MNKTNLRLTRSQLLLWTGQQLDLQSPLYNMVLTFRIKGVIDPTHFQHAFAQLVAQSEVMRSVFLFEQDLPYRQIRAHATTPLEYLDWSTRADIESVYQKWATQRSQQIFNLSECLYDAVLIKMQEGEYLWYLNQHHLITDGWSVSLQYQTLADYYALSLKDELSPAEPLPSFEDYSTYEQNNQTDPQQQQTRAYWNKKADAFPPLPKLYGRKPTPPSSQASCLSIELGQQRTEQLRALCQEPSIRAWTQDLALFNIFSTVLFAYLYRISGQEQLVIGTPTHNRVNAQFKSTPGVFIETFPLLIELEETDSFEQLLQKVKIEANQFLRYAQPGMSTARLNRGFNVVLNYITASFPDFNGQAMQSEWIHPGHMDAGHHLRIQVHDFDRSASIRLRFELNRAIFNEQQAAQATQHFLTLLDQFILNREVAIRSVKWPLAKQDIFRLGNYKPASPHLFRSAIQRFESVAEEQATAIALRLDDQTMTYAELNQQANQLAQQIRSHSLSDHPRIVLYLQRSFELMISILAVLKTGGTYVPIPTSDPDHRIQAKLNDAQAELLISTPKLRHRLPTSTPAYLEVTPQSLSNTAKVVASPASVTQPEQLAYLLYTSGSTGTPKGVMISQAALSNYLDHCIAHYTGVQRIIMPLFTSIGFDLSVSSVFLPLICGGTIVIFPEPEVGPDLSILEVLRHPELNTIKLTPSHLEFIKEVRPEATAVDCLILGGEGLRTKLTQQALAFFGDQVKIYNEYGPTEATVGCVVHQFDVEKDIADFVPIGHPIEQMEGYVLDEFQHPVPQGVGGELYLAGAGLSDGYWQLEKETNAVFLPNPFNESSLYYRTGDQVRVNEQGQLEFLERVDFQVKINGHRVELGEIENLLNQHPAIDHSLVQLTSIDQANEEQTRQLMAYYTAKAETSAKSLQEHLQHQLPDHMIPTQFVQLDQFPLTANGKIDRRALAHVQGIKMPTEAREKEAPRNFIEERLLELWQEFLPIKDIGIHDKFIALGGDSLMGIRLLSSINDAFEMELPVTTIFQYPSIAVLADHIQQTLEKLLAAFHQQANSDDS